MCISWKIKCLILLMHGATLKLMKKSFTCGVCSSHPLRTQTLSSIFFLHSHSKGVRSRQLFLDDEIDFSTVAWLQLNTPPSRTNL